MRPRVRSGDLWASLCQSPRAISSTWHEGRQGRDIRPSSSALIKILLKKIDFSLYAGDSAFAEYQRLYAGASMDDMLQVWIDGVTGVTPMIRTPMKARWPRVASAVQPYGATPSSNVRAVSASTCQVASAAPPSARVSAHRQPKRCMCADIRAQQTKAVQHAGFSVGNSGKANGLHAALCAAAFRLTRRCTR